MTRIYIESQTLLENKQAVEWLDGCGAKKITDTFDDDTKTILVCKNKSLFKIHPVDVHHIGELKHTPTALEFCQGVAKIMGIPEPTFGEPTISKTETVEPIKGMAIEVSRLSEEEIQTIVLMCGEAWAEVPKQALKNSNERYLYYKDGGLDCHHKPALIARGYTITDSPTEFLEYVAQQTGKEYQPNIVNLPPNTEQKMLYPSHKVYRILDSLDGIPLDTRIPLSEWIPPFGSYVVLFNETKGRTGRILGIEKGALLCKDTFTHNNFSWLLENGHWMRIV